MSTKRTSKSVGGGGEDQEETKQLQNGDGGASSSDEGSSSDDDSLVLEGAVIRNPDISDSDDSSEEEEVDDSSKRSKKKQKTNNNGKSPKSKPKKKASNQPETIQVEFLFCDMNERFFHGLKTLIHRNTIHSSHSSQLADLVIENIMVGTVLSTDQDDDNVFGFASVVNLTTNSSSPCIEALKKLCLDKCPQQHKPEMETVLSGKTKRPAGFFFQERMVNVPLEITEVLHQQLVLDMDHAVKNASDDDKKSLDFGAFVRLAPCYSGGGTGGANSAIYKYFDDEIFATNAEFVYTFDAPKMFEGDEEDLMCSVIVMTKTGHRAAMKDLKKMVAGN
ncbi:hypothetical protein ACHAWC_009777 [Mediolabrus comicus]